MKKKKIEEEERERLTLASATYSEAEAETEAEAIIMSSYLSEDIMENILSRLPVKSIKRFRCVCKLWDNLFRNPDFINMHHNRGIENENFNLMITEGDLNIYSSIDNYCNPSSLTCLEMAEINYPFKDSTLRVNIWGVCNGLLCIIACCDLEDIICIWNPSTKEYKRIPFPPLNWMGVSNDASPMVSACGLGYDCNIGDYKLVYIKTFSCDFYSLHCQVKVYTLGSNSWKHNTVIYPYGILTPGVLVNGTLHWVATDRGPRHTTLKDPCVIVSFDFGVERFTQVPMPEHLDDSEFLLNVSALGGCLCIYDEDCFEVWVMKDYGVRESWTKLCNVAQQSLGSCYNKLIQPFKNDEYLLYIASETKDSLVVYNPKKERVRALKINLGYLFAAMTYVESLVPLDTGTYVVQERVAELKDYDEKEEKQEKDDVGLQLF